MKICKKCLIEKNEIEFYMRGGKPSSPCKECTYKVAKEWRNKNKKRVRKSERKRYAKSRSKDLEQHRNWRRNKALQSTYGITLEEYNRMAEEQKNRCYICNEEPSGRFTRLCVDHNHSTKKIRKLLCNNCNRALGLMKDNPLILKRASEYLNEF